MKKMSVVSRRRPMVMAGQGSQGRSPTKPRQGVVGSVVRLQQLSLGFAMMACLTIICGVWTMTCHAGSTPASDPFNPTVTKEESELLHQVMDMAPSNTTDAIKLLNSQNLRKASPALNFALGNLYFQTEKLEAAKEAYEAALDKLPKFRAALGNLGRVYLLQDQTDKAIRIYQSLVRDGQADENILILLGHALLLSGHSLSAENAYRQALLLKPNDKGAMLGLAKCLLQQERFCEGNSLLKEVLIQDVGRTELWSLYSNSYLTLDKMKNAVISIECAKRLGVASPGMLATLGDLYLNQHQPDEAVKAYETAFNMEEPSVTCMLRATEGFMMIEEPERAAHLIEKASQLQEKAPNLFQPDQRRKLLCLKADLAVVQGDMETAKKTYEALLKEDPINGQVMIKVGDLHREANELEQAVIAYERAARIPGFQARALVRQAQVEIDRERYKEAVILLEAAQAFDEQPHIARYLEQVRRLSM